MRNAAVRKLVPVHAPAPAVENEPAAAASPPTRALMLMEAFKVGEPSLALAELSHRTGMHKTTVLRLARTLAQSGYMVQREDAPGAPQAVRHHVRIG
jgi:hypothetical protein